MYYAVIIELAAYKKDKKIEERTYHYLTSAVNREQLEMKKWDYLNEAKDRFNMILSMDGVKNPYYQTKSFNIVPAEEYYSLDSLSKKIPMKEFTKIWKRCLAVTE